ncbi:hypothetical protein AB0F18_38665, partial [Streptomyces sp. NPDC029216]|uniref:hypothetical protein n=1 Tax=Streptomyces sp. NPDC029216 TaxID=3154701 RepID=UPI0033FA45CC
MPREHTDSETGGPHAAGRPAPGLRDAGLRDAGRDPAADRRGPADGPAGAGLRTLAGLLRAAGLDPSPEELADALWL